MKVRITLCLLLMVTLVLPVLSKAKADVEIPDYSTTPRSEIPVEYTWNIDDIYPSMEAWEKEKTEVTAMFGEIDKYADGWTSSPEKFLAMMEFQTEMMKRGYRLFGYISNQANMDLGDQKLQKLMGQLQVIFIQARSKMAFMNDDILKLGEDKFNEFLKAEPKLQPYAFGILNTLRGKKHVLPKEQQVIASMTGLFSGAPSKVSGILNNMELPTPEITLSDGKKVVLNYANYAKYRASKNREDRQAVMDAYWSNHKKFENTFAALMDAGIKNHLFNAKIRNHTDCLDAALFGNNIDPTVYENLIKQVRANLDPFHRYLKLKKELLGLDTLIYSDIYASSVKSVDVKYSYDQATKMVVEAMKPMGKEYCTVLQKAFDSRWVDIYPNKGKQSGAYSSGVYGVHPFVKMNYDGSYDNVSTLAHEMGHALHTHFSDQKQPFANSDYPTFLAEIASTFNENLLVRYMLQNEKDDLLKLFILDNFIQGIKGTVYRQTQFAEFELAMHRRVESGQPLTAEWLNKTYLELVRYYYGHDKGVMEVGDYIQNEWASIPHFYYNYYVYTYSTGFISSMALSDIVLKGKKAEQQKYLDFLSAGGSDYPLNTLKKAGVDMTTAAPFEAAFSRISGLVDEMENIVKRLKKKGKI